MKEAVNLEKVKKIIDKHIYYSLLGQGETPTQEVLNFVNTKFGKELVKKIVIEKNYLDDLGGSIKNAMETLYTPVAGIFSLETE